MPAPRATTDPHSVFTAQQVCTGDRRYGNQTLPGYDGKTVAIGSTPYGTYSASDIPVRGGAEVTFIDVTFPARFISTEADFNGNQAYTLSVKGCMVKFGNPATCVPFPGVTDEPINDGHFVAEDHFAGSQFIPRRMAPIDMVLKIHWCPDQNWFVVNFLGEQLTTPLVHRPNVFVTVPP